MMGLIGSILVGMVVLYCAMLAWMFYDRVQRHKKSMAALDKCIATAKEINRMMGVVE